MSSAQEHANAKAAAPTAAPDEIKARNQAALAARKAKVAEQKRAEAAAALPDGWKRVESRSRPGEFVYENIHTEERQAWFPTEPAAEESAPQVAAAAPADEKAALIAKNKAALAKRKAEAQAAKDKVSKLPLPPGWKRGESRSRPGEVVYENEMTGERQAWFPDGPAEGMDEETLAKKEMMKKNAEALKKRKAALAKKKSDDAGKALPDGWKRVESRSRPGEFVYENIHTEERQAWFPDAPAEQPLPAGWRKVESRSYPGEFVYENEHTLERQAWRPDESAPTTENQVVAPAKDAAPIERPEPIATCKALYDYVAAAGGDDEIDLQEDDIIHVEYKAENGWWVGTNTRTNKSGIFPGTYVEAV